MNIGQKLLELRKEKKLSQEEAADKLNVTRQTISKWETDQSTPDFDKIVPICELYGITSDELLMGKKNESIDKTPEVIKEDITKKRAIGIGKSVLLYFVAVSFLIVSITIFRMNPIIATAIFLLICGVATYLIIYTSITYKESESEEEKKQKSVYKQISNIFALITLIIYLFISFMTMAWHITWILWIVLGLIDEILKLIFILRGNKNEE